MRCAASGFVLAREEICCASERCSGIIDTRETVGGRRTRGANEIER